MSQDTASHGQLSPQPTTDFPLPLALSILTALEALVLLAAAIQLYHFPLRDGLRWPWDVQPYNAVFLGGLYWAAFAAVGFQAWVRRWSTARLVQPMVLVFSVVLLGVSLAYLGVFDWQRRWVKAWFLVYFVVYASAAISTFTYRDCPCANPVQLPPRYKAILQTKAACLGLYGMALLLIPAFSTAFWPWPIDAFHARLYSAIFLATGVGNGLLSRSAAALELLVLGVVELLLGALLSIGIFNLDYSVGRIEWSQLGSLLWLLLLGVWAIAGLQLIRQALRWKPVQPAKS